MTLPRQVLPERFYLLTRRCTQRQFLLRPDDETNNAFVYCLAEAAERFQIELIVAQQMSNHHHTTLFDRYGRIIEFAAHFHKMLAKCQNALRGRWENMWSTHPPSIVELVDRNDVIDKLVYTATNPVLDHLVDRVDHWPGARTVRALLQQEPLRAHRPARFFRETGVMPATVALNFTIPVELGDRDEILAEVKARIAAVELECERQRMASGRKIVGRGAIRKQDWNASPETYEPRRGLSPRIAAKWKWARIEALQRNREFQDEYRRARRAWLTAKQLGSELVFFPPGTYWLARFANVSVRS